MNSSRMKLRLHASGNTAWGYFNTQKREVNIMSNERIMGEAAGSDKSYQFRIETPNSPMLHLLESERFLYNKQDAEQKIW